MEEGIPFLFLVINEVSLSQYLFTGKLENIDGVSDAMCLAMIMDGAIIGSDWVWAATVVQALFCTGCPKKRNNIFFRLWTLLDNFGTCLKSQKKVQSFFGTPCTK